MNVLVGILESVCLSVCPCVSVSVCLSMCQSVYKILVSDKALGGGIKSHIVTALVFFCMSYRMVQLHNSVSCSTNLIIRI